MVHEHVAGAESREDVVAVAAASGDGVCGANGGYFSSGRAAARRAPRARRGRAARRSRRRRSASSSSSRQSSSSTSGVIVVSTSSRTERPNFVRCRSTTSIASSRSSASSDSSKSASRVTRNAWCAEHLHAGEQRVEVRRDHLLERDEARASSGSATNRGSSGGTFTRANRSSPSAGRARRPRG